MPNSGLHGSYPLTFDEIARVVTRKSAGAYTLGSSANGYFFVRYVGRSDSDVADRLEDHIDYYPRFKFCYSSSPKAAFEKECELYHMFGGKAKLDNERHPARPNGTNWKCPMCDIYSVVALITGALSKGSGM